MPQSTITAAIARAHERLVPRVTALLKQVERSATRHPQAPLPPATRAVAKTLFAESRKIIGREAGEMASAALADLSGLSVGLGQLAALLEAFEAEHSGWSRTQGAVAWRLENGAERPVGRLRAAAARPGGASAPKAQAVHDYGHMGKTHSQAIKTLFRRMNEREAEAYTQGYHDAMAGRDRTLPEPLE